MKNKLFIKIALIAAIGVLSISLVNLNLMNQTNGNTGAPTKINSITQSNSNKGLPPPCTPTPKDAPVVTHTVQYSTQGWSSTYWTAITTPFTGYQLKAGNYESIYMDPTSAMTTNFMIVGATISVNTGQTPYYPAVFIDSYCEGDIIVGSTTYGSNSITSGTYGVQIFDDNTPSGNYITVENNAISGQFQGAGSSGQEGPCAIRVSPSTAGESAPCKVTIDHNTIGTANTNNQGVGIWYDGTNTGSSIYDNYMISGNVHWGIEIRGQSYVADACGAYGGPCSGVSVWGNQITTDNAAGSVGIFLTKDPTSGTTGGNTMITSVNVGGAGANTVYNSQVGIELSNYASSCTISSNTVYGCPTDIDLESYAYSNTISGNSINPSSGSSTYGILVNTGTNNNHLSGNIIKSCSSYGIYLTAGCYSNLINGNNQISGLGNYAILSDGSSYSNTISGNTFTSNGWGIVLWGSTSATTISGNTFSSNGGGVYVNVATTITINGGNSFSGGSYGVYLASTTGVSALNSNSFSSSTYGIVFDSSSSITSVSGNTFTSCTTAGILVETSSASNTISSNTFSGGQYGLDINNANTNTISSNTISGCSSDGIRVESSSHNNNLLGNTIYSCSEWGISLLSSANTNILCDNNIYSTTSDGIHLDSSTSNLISGCTVRLCPTGINIIDSANTNTFKNNILLKNTGYGISVASGCTGCVFQRNDFIANNNNVSPQISDASASSSWGGSSNTWNFYDDDPAGTAYASLETAPSHQVINVNANYPSLTRPAIITPAASSYVHNVTAISWYPSNDTTVVDSAHLASLYRFEEGTQTSGAYVIDSKGSNVGTNIGPETWTASGKRGGGIIIQNTLSDYINIPSATNLQISGNPGTSWGAWVDVSSYTPTVSGADSGGIIWKSGEYGLRTQSGGTFVAYVYTSSGLEGISVAGYATGTWYYVMATYTTSPSNTLSLYINGALVVQNTAIPGSISATGNALVIGQQPGDGPFQGTIDDVAIYNTAETLANINAIYTQNPEAIGYQVTLNSVAILGSGWTWTTTSGSPDLSSFTDAQNIPLVVSANAGSNTVYGPTVLITVHNKLQTPPSSLAIATAKSPYGNYYWGQISITWTGGSDYDGITQTQLFISSNGGTSWTSISSTSATSGMTWDTDTVPNGNYIMEVQQVSTHGAVGYSWLGTFAIQNQPYVSAYPLGISPQHYGAYSPFPIYWTVYGPTAGGWTSLSPAYSVYLDGSLSYSSYWTIAGQGVNDLSYTVPSTLTVGTHSIYVVVNNGTASGSSTSSTSTFQVLDNMPNIINQSPIFYNITGGQNANLQWQLVCNTLNGASATYWVYLNGTQEQTGTFTNNQIITYTVPNNLATLNLPYYYNYTIVVYNGYTTANNNQSMYVVQVFNPVAFSLAYGTSYTYHYGGSTIIGWFISDPNILVANNANWTILQNGVTTKNFSTWSTANVLATFTVPTTQNLGTYQYTLLVELVVGGTTQLNALTNATQLVTVTVQSVIPNVVVSGSPAPTINYGSTMNIGWTITDTNITAGATYWVYMNGSYVTQGTWAVTGYLAQYSLPLPPTQQVAQYVYNIIADNGYHDGNFTSPTITVTVLSIPAVITVLSSPSLVINYSTQVSLTWSIGSPTISAAGPPLYWLLSNGSVVQDVAYPVQWYANQSSVNYKNTNPLAQGLTLPVWYNFTMVADNGYYVNGSSTPIWVEVLPNQPVITISGNATQSVNYGTSLPIKWFINENTFNMSGNPTYCVLLNGSVVEIDPWSFNGNYPALYQTNIGLGNGYYNYTLLVDNGYHNNVTSPSIMVQVLNGALAIINTGNPSYQIGYGSTQMLQWNISCGALNNVTDWYIVYQDGVQVAFGSNWNNNSLIVYTTLNSLAPQENPGHSYYVEAWNGITTSGGLYGNSAPVVVNVTDIPPTINVFGPNSYTVNYGQNATLQWQIFDTTVNAGTSWEIFQNGTLVSGPGTWISGSVISYTTLFNLAVDQPPGCYNYTLQAFNGYYSTVTNPAASITLNVMNNAPTITIISPTTFSFQYGQNATLEWNIVDNTTTGAPAYAVYVNGTATPLQIGTWASNSNIFYYTLSTLGVDQSPGYYNFTIVVDNGYHNNVTSQIIKINVLNNPATVAIIGASSFSFQYGQNATLEWNIVDNTTVPGSTAYAIYVNGTVNPVQVGTWTTNTNIFYYTIPTLPVNQLPGGYIYTIVVDNGYHNNVTSSGITVNVNNNPPVLSILGLNILTYHYNGSAIINWTIVDNTTTGSPAYWVMQNGTVVATSTWTTNATFGAEVQYTTLSTLAVLQAPGNYYFTLVVDNGYHMNVTSAGISVSITPNPAFLVFNGTNPVVVNYGNAIQLNWTIFDDSFNLSGNPSYWIYQDGVLTTNGTWIANPTLVMFTPLNNLGVKTSPGYNFTIIVCNGYMQNTSSTIFYQVMSIPPTASVYGTAAYNINYGQSVNLQWIIYDTTVNLTGNPAYWVFLNNNSVITQVATGFWSTTGTIISYSTPVTLGVNQAPGYYYYIIASNGYLSNATSGSIGVVVNFATPSISSQSSQVTQSYGTIGTQINWVVYDPTINGTPTYTIYLDTFSPSGIVAVGTWNINSSGQCTITYTIPATLGISSGHYYFLTLANGYSQASNFTSSPIIAVIQNEFNFQVVNGAGASVGAGTYVDIYYGIWTNATTNAAGNVTYIAMQDNCIYNVIIMQTYNGINYTLLSTSVTIPANTLVAYATFMCNTTNVILQIDDVNGLVPVSSATILITELGNPNINYTQVSSATGNVTFLAMPYNTNWNMYITWIDALSVVVPIYNATFNIANTTTFVRSATIACNLTNMELDFKDHNNLAITGARVVLTNTGTHPGLTFNTTTDSNGAATYYQLFNDTWQLNVYYQLLGNQYAVYSGPFVIATNLFFNRTTLSNCNMTNLILTLTDNSINNPAYWAIWGATVSLLNNTNGASLGVYTSDTNGQIDLELPRTTYNFTISYQGILKPFVFQQNIGSQPIGGMAYTNNSALNVITYDGTIYMNITMSIDKTIVSIANFSFMNSGNWAAVQTNSTTNPPYNVQMYYGDGFVLNISYIDVEHSPALNIPISGAIGNWNITRSSSIALTNVSLTTNDQHNGFYIFDISSSAMNLWQGAYVFSIYLSANGNQSAFLQIGITILNQTAVMTQISSNTLLQNYYGLPITINVTYSSVSPLTGNLPNAALFMNVVGTGYTGIPLSYNAITQEYGIAWNSSLATGTYTMTIYGNQTNYAWASLSVLIQILAFPGNLTYAIIPSQAAGTKTLTTSVGENITFYFNFTEDGIHPFANYSLATLSVTLDGSSFLQFYNLGNGQYLSNTPVSSLGIGVGVHTIMIQAQYPNYQLLVISITANIISLWNAQLVINQALSSYTWNETATFIVNYTSIQFPRSGMALTAAQVMSLNITTLVGSIQTPVLFLTSANIVQGQWNYTNNGDGTYTIWFKTNLISISSQQIFYITPMLTESYYVNGSLMSYFSLRPVIFSMKVTNQASPGQQLNLLTLAQTDPSATVQAALVINDPLSHLNGYSLNGALVTYQFYNDTSGNTSIYLPGYGILTNGPGGLYTMPIIPLNTPIGQFTIVINATIPDFYSVSYSFILVIEPQRIGMTFSIPSQNQVTIGAIKIASGENATFLITITNSGLLVDASEITVYLDTVFSTPLGVYPTIDPTIFNCTFATTDTGIFTVGTHQIIINATHAGYLSNQLTLSLQIVAHWNTQITFLVPLDVYEWGQTAWFVINYSADDFPQFQGLDDANITQIQLMTDISNLSTYITLDWSQLNVTWTWQNLAGVSGYGPGCYNITFLTNMVNVNTATPYYVQAVINQGDYLQQTVSTATSISPVQTTLHYSAFNQDTLLPLGNPMQLNQYANAILTLTWQITDSISPSNGINITTGSLIYYMTYKANGTIFIAPTPINPLIYGSYIYTLRIPSTDADQFYLYIQATLTNFQEQTLQFEVDVGTHPAQFNINIDPSMVFEFSSIKTDQSGNVTFALVFNANSVPNGDGIDFSSHTLSQIGIIIKVDGISINQYLYPDAADEQFNCTFPATFIGVGSHLITITDSCVNYGDYSTSLTCIIVSSWQTTTALVTAPTIYPWGNTATFSIQYLANEDPRSGWTLNSSIVNSIAVIGRQTTYTFNNTTLGTDWGWTNDGNGIYSIWFITSNVPVTAVTSFYISVTISQLYYQTQSPAPYIWITPVQTTLTALNLVSNGTTAANFTSLQETTLVLDQNESVYLSFVVTDQNSIFLGQNITDGSLTYMVINKNDATDILMVGTVSLDATYVKLYSFQLDAIKLGQWVVYVTATRANYAPGITQFLLNVVNKTIVYSLGAGFPNNSTALVSVAKNEQISFSINTSNEPNATVIVEFNNENYTLTQSGTSGVYTFTITPSMMSNFTENTNQPIHVYIIAENYTTVDIPVTVAVGFSVDPIFHIPYMYWLLVGGMVAIIVSILFINYGIRNARIPLIIKRISKAEKIILKNQAAPEQHLTLTLEQEIFKRYGQDWAEMKLDMLYALGLSKEDIRAADEELQTDMQIKQRTVEEDIIDKLLKIDTNPALAGGSKGPNDQRAESAASSQQSAKKKATKKQTVQKRSMDEDEIDKFLLKGK